jgi:hypothetical protein
MNTTESKRYQQALSTFCTQQCPEYFVTLAFHADHPLNIHRAETCLRHFAAQLDRLLLGKRWAQSPAESRTQFIALPEGRRVRLMLTPAKGKKAAVSEDALRILASRSWGKCAPAGDVDLQALPSDADRQRVASYACKRIADAGSIGLERFVIAPICPKKSAPRSAPGLDGRTAMAVRARTTDNSHGSGVRDL